MHFPFIRNTQAYVRYLMEHEVITLAEDIGASGDPNTAGPVTADFPNGSPIGVGVAGPGSTFVNQFNGVTYVNVGTTAVPVWELVGMALQPTNTLWYGGRAGSIPTGSPGAPGIMQPFGTPNFATAGAVDGDNDQEDGTYLRFTTAASGGSAAGLQGARNGPQVRHNPILKVKFRTGADITSIRFWMGLSTNLLANVDDIGGSSEYAMIRYSTVAADTGFMAVTRNAALGQTVHGKIANILSNTNYLLTISKNPTSGSWIFDLNGETFITGDAGLVATTKLHDFVSQIFTQVASARSYLVSSLYGQYGT